MKQRHFGTYLSARQRKLHKEISEIVVSLCRPETFEFIGDYEDIITQQELTTSQEQNNTAEEVLKAILEEDHKHFSKEESPNLSQLFMGKDRLPMCILNALFCELLNILKRKTAQWMLFMATINVDVPSLFHRKNFPCFHGKGAETEMG